MLRSTLTVLASVACWIAAVPALAATARPYDVTEERAACKSYEPLRQPLFGDTHVHTAYSFDASTQDTRNTPHDAYRFARGEEVGIQPYDASGNALRRAKLARPLDWTAVTDHAELLGEVRTCTDPNAPGFDSDICWKYQTMRPIMIGPFALRTMILKQRMAFCGEDGEICRANARDAWRDIQAAAEEAYDRSDACRFTSFVGYEWTATAGNGFNLHRNVVFRNASVPHLPGNWVDSRSAFHHWQQLQERCIDGTPGCEALTIPHNSNIGGDGLMFETARLASMVGAARGLLPDRLQDRRRLRQPTGALVRALAEALAEKLRHRLGHGRDQHRPCRSTPLLRGRPSACFRSRRPALSR